MPYELLIKADRGCIKKSCSFALFLKSKADQFIVIRGCPGLSYLNTEERAMSDLNIRLVNLSLKLSPILWLLEEFL